MTRNGVKKKKGKVWTLVVCEMGKQPQPIPRHVAAKLHAEVALFVKEHTGRDIIMERYLDGRCK